MHSYYATSCCSKIFCAVDVLGSMLLSKIAPEINGMFDILLQRNHPIFVLIDAVKCLHGLLLAGVRFAHFEIVCPLTLLQEVVSIGVDGSEVG